MELYEMVGHRKLHSTIWRCRECFLGDTGSFDSPQNLITHLQDEHGMTLFNLDLKDGEIFIPVHEEGGVLTNGNADHDSSGERRTAKYTGI